MLHQMSYARDDQACQHQCDVTFLLAGRLEIEIEAEEPKHANVLEICKTPGKLVLQIHSSSAKL